MSEQPQPPQRSEKRDDQPRDGSASSQATARIAQVVAGALASSVQMCPIVPSQTASARPNVPADHQSDASARAGMCRDVPEPAAMSREIAKMQNEATAPH